MVAVNSGTDEDGNANYGTWFSQNNLDVLGNLLNDDPIQEKLSEEDKRLLRRCVVFQVTDFLMDIPNGSRKSGRAKTLMDAMKGRSGSA